MPKLISILLTALIVGAAHGASILTPVDVVPEEKPVEQVGPVARDFADVGPRVSLIRVGEVDTIGGTTYDWQTGMPIWGFLVNAPDHGLHAQWLYSASTGTTFPDRNNRYNFRDHQTGEWAWIDTNFMNSGVGVFTERAGWGNVAADPNTGVAVISAHYGTPLAVNLARDVSPGAGAFEFCSGSPQLEGCLWAVVDVDVNSAIHIVCTEDIGDRDNAYYASSPTWCNWTTPLRVAPPKPDPMFPSQNIAASKVSEKVCLTWVYSPDGYSQKPGFYRLSTDGGANWGPPTQLPWPPAYGGDTLTSFHITSLYPFYDRSDVLHIVAGVVPFFQDTNYIMPAEIWHWCPENDTAWHEVHRAGCENLEAGIGYNATYACRPSIGEDSVGNLYVAWEQFDSSNVEIETSRLRADIFLSVSPDNGRSWTPGLKITERSTVSHRFPSVVDFAAGSGLRTQVLYMDDQVAGFFVQGEGPVTQNPILVHDVSFASIEERPAERPSVSIGQSGATIARGSLYVPRTLDHSTPWTLVSITGQKVTSLRPGPNDIGHVASGVYFLRSPVSGARPAITKVVVQE